jgi:hypothetical protein
MTSRIDTIVSLIKTAASLTTGVDHQGNAANLGVITESGGYAIYVEETGFNTTNQVSSLIRQVYNVTIKANSLDNLETQLNVIMKLPQTYAASTSTPYQINVVEGGRYKPCAAGWYTNCFFETFWRLS